MHARLWHAPLIIALWQAAPVAIERDPVTNKYRLYVGAEAGQFENRTIACDGSVIDAIPVDLQRAGAAFDAWFGPHTRLRAAVGTGDPGAHSAIRLNGEWRAIGLGLGAWAGRDYENGGELFAPSMYLRFGNADALHVTMDVFPPDLGPVAGGAARLGLGYRQGYAGGTGWFLGIAVPPFADERYTLAGQGELHTQVTGSVDLMIRALLGPGYQRSTWGLGLGARVELP